jgi:formamidopyrimidine-DNA glycosylase
LPELPDLEVVRDILSPRIVGQAVRGVEVNRPDLLRTGEGSVSLLVGKELHAIGRRGKYLLFSFGPEAHLLVHLMRWGWLWHGPHGYTPTTATQLRLMFDDGSDLRLIEARSPYLAAVWVVPDPKTAEPLRGLGVEPLSAEFTPEVLRHLIAGKRRPLKRFLTDQSLIAGIGNAYADEILFRARLSPVRYTHTLTEDELDRLWHAIGEALRWAIREIRARVGDALVDREVRDFLFVHGKKGNPCRECGTPIAEILFEDARTNYCPRCQGPRVVLPLRRG